MRLYLAAPLYNAQERRYNEHLASILEHMGYRVFLPQRDGRIAYDLIKKPEDVPQVRNNTYLGDLAELMSCDGAVAVLNGIVTDPGTCVEIGMLAARRTLQGASNSSLKFIVGLHDDYRALDKYGISPMVEGALTNLFHNEERLLEFLHSQRRVSEEKTRIWERE